MKVAKPGDAVEINYVAKIESGEVFDTSYEEVAKRAGIHSPQRVYAPLPISIGEGKVIKVLEDALIGTKEGEEKEIKVPPGKAYGERREGLVQRIPKQAFIGSNIKPTPGVRIKTPQGVGEIKKVSEENVEVDFNHPLAGETLVFEVKVESVTKKAGR
ncbi:MAG: peptidylprolyl isomerase [Candidatus Hydrothermarchaeaceae archaeon]